MATHKRTKVSAQQQRQRRNFMFIGFAALIVVVLIGSVAAIGRRSTDAATMAATQPLNLEVSNNGVPANAEPQGRAWGPKDAPITVIEYADYECESCGYFATTHEKEFTETFAESGKVRFEIRNAPFHGQGSRNAAQASYCAAEQNQFWPMHDSLFLNQPTHGATMAENFNPAMLTTLAGKLSLDAGAFEQCLSSGKYAQQIEQDYQTTVQDGVTGTPTFVINGKTYVGPQSTANFRRIFAEVAPDVTFE